MAETLSTHLVSGFTPTRICILGNKLGLGCGKAPYLNDGLQAKGSKVSQYCKAEPRFSWCELVLPWVPKGGSGEASISKQSSTLTRPTQPGVMASTSFRKQAEAAHGSLSRRLQHQEGASESQGGFTHLPRD